jgi:aromatic-L-amino-acid decarboxylase
MESEHESAGPMTAEEFRRNGRAVIDWIAHYMEDVERYPVLSRVRPGEIRAALPEDPPEKGEPFENLLGDLDRIVLPGVTHWQSPNFFAYFPANASAPSILGDLVSSGLGVQGMLWATSPACTELETHVLDWLVDLLGLPDAFRSTSAGGGVIQDTASSATLCALLAARERATGWSTNETGVDRPLTAYTSTEGHSSVEKSVRIAGLGDANLRKVEVDESFAMRPEALDRAIQEDVEAGRTPCFVTATVGTTSSTAIDPVRAIGEICRRHGVWLHVDAALAGTAALCPEHRWIHDGLELADSYCYNPHKWMLTNFDCDCFYVADRSALIRTLALLPEYLRNVPTESGAVFDYRDWHVPMGRRFRALKLWFVLRTYGAEGLRAHVREQVGLAREFAGWVENDPRFGLAAPVPLNLVCFRLVDGSEETNRKLLDRLNASGKIYLTHTKLAGKLCLRLAVGGAHTRRRHVEGAWKLISDTAGEVLSGGRE